MKNVTFYVLDNDHHQDGLNAVEQLVCNIATERWRSGKSILVACENEQQAIHLDKALWVYPAGRFVPHNVSSEGTKCNAPIEIAWIQENNNSDHDTIINLRVKFIDFITTFTEVIDFVPHKESLKQLARERYKSYRLAGFNLNTTTWKYEKDI